MRWHGAEQQHHCTTAINDTAVLPSRKMKFGIIKSITTFMNIRKPMIKKVETFPARSEAERTYKQRHKTVPIKLRVRRVSKIIRSPGQISKRKHIAYLLK